MKTIILTAFVFVSLFIAYKPVFGDDSTNVDKGRDKLLFNSQEQADQMFKRQSMEMQAQAIKQFQDNGDYIWGINDIKLNYQIQDSGILITNLDCWMKTFKAQVLNPAVVFDVRDVLPVDFSTPIAAEQSYRLAIYHGDALTLLDNADANGKYFFEHILNVDKSKKVPSYEIFKRLTHFTVLLTAAYRFQGNDYIMVLIRAQENENPKNGIVIIQGDMFKHVRGQFVFTGDIDSGCAFGNVLKAAGAKMSFLEHYSKFYEHMSCSTLPPSFYTIEN